jgi:hypothetical protein
MFLYRHRVRSKLGDATMVWINPRRVQFHGGSNQPYTKRIKEVLHRLEAALPVFRNPARRMNSILYSLEPFSIKASLLSNLKPIETMATYRRIANAIECRDDPTRSEWYADLMAELQRDGVAIHKTQRFHSEPEIRGFFASYVGGLIDSMETGGYDMTKTHDTGTAMIGSDGTIIKFDAGNHRFSVARILGVPLVPMEILGAHEDWMRSMKIGSDTDKLQAGLRQVEELNR